VVAFLSQDWLDLQRLAVAGLALEPDAEAAAAVIQTTVTGAPGGAVSYTTTIEHGRLVAAALGEASGQPDLTFSLPFAHAVQLARGEVELSTLFMRGDLKVEGDMRKLFALLAVDHRPATRTLITDLAAQIDF
jgi:hypothetical protein